MIDPTNNVSTMRDIQLISKTNRSLEQCAAIDYEAVAQSCGSAQGIILIREARKIKKIIKNNFFFLPTDMNKIAVYCSKFHLIVHIPSTVVMFSSSISARALHDSTSGPNTNFPLSISNEMQVCYPQSNNENPTQPTA